MWYNYVFIGIGVLIFGLFILSYVQAKHASIKLSAEEFKNQMRKGQLIDCRTKHEYDSGHISGAKNINVQIIAREYKKIRKDQPIYLYCASGKRSTRAAIYLKARGYANIYELKEGLKSWDGQLK